MGYPSLTLMTITVKMAYGKLSKIPLNTPLEKGESRETL